MSEKARTRSDGPVEGRSPNEVLAQEIVSALVAEGLISPVDGDSLEPILGSGDVDASKWRNIFETNLQRKVDSNGRE